MIGSVQTGGVAGARTVRLVPSGVELPQSIVSKEGTTEAKAATKPPVDSGRVAELRAAIAQGSYQIDSAKIAERMISLDLPQE